jgi:Glu-tRNA(Gln) amidotransferase subunit E-like FAD-binding protein
MEHELDPILTKLAGIDRRSIGHANEVVADVISDPSLLEIVFKGMSYNDPVLRMRCADVVEKVTARYPEYLVPYKRYLIDKVSKIDQQEVRWHVAQLFSRLELTNDDRKEVLKILSDYLKDKSKIVKTFSMQALADIAEQDNVLKSGIIQKLEVLTREGSPAMKSRGRKLLSKLRAR